MPRRASTCRTERPAVWRAARAVARIERVAPQVTIERVEGAGHDLALSQADVVNARVLAFLRG